eukprot:g1992.t1
MTSSHVEVDGCMIHYLRWRPDPLPRTLREEGLEPPSIVFLHGTSAHAHWYHHIAPHFVEDGYEAVAISFSGHGDSGTRPVLGKGIWAEEVVAVARHLGLFDSRRAAPPVVVGHSLGSYVAEEVAGDHADLIYGIVALDGAIPHPMLWTMPNPPPGRERKRQDYCKGDKEEDGGNDDEEEEEEAPAWTWKFDPLAPTKYTFGSMVGVGVPDVIRSLPVRVAAIYGADSAIVTRATQAYMRLVLGDHVSLVAIPDAEHHCFLDQPLACVAALRMMLAEWNRSATAAAGGATLLPRRARRSTHSDSDGDRTAMRARSKKWMQSMTNKELMRGPGRSRSSSSSSSSSSTTDTSGRISSSSSRRSTGEHPGGGGGSRASSAASTSSRSKL